MPRHVEALEPARLVSIVQPEFQPARPAGIASEAHLRVGVHDITDRRQGGILIEERHVVELVRFLEAWEPAEGALLVHCWAGISRSTATALIARYVKSGGAEASALALRAAAPHAIPNRRIVQLADDVLGCGGALIGALEGMGEPSEWLNEAPLVVVGV
jgi:predicted protein tyrosine phosphatase